MPSALGLTVLLALGAGPAAAGAPAACKAPEELARSFPPGFFKCPGCSVLLIDLDGLRPDRLGYARAGASLTPFIDSMAKKGVVFRNAASQSDWTYPSAASVVTSEYPSTHRTLATDSVFDPAMPTVFSAFAAGGYRIFGNKKRPFVSVKTMSMDINEHTFEDEDYFSELESQLAWIAASSAPALSYVMNLDMHLPYWRLGGPTDGEPAPPELLDAMRTVRPGYLPGVPAAVARGFNRAYDDRVRWLDARLRMLFSRIDKARLRERTIVVLFSNHGEALFEHSLLGHGYGYHDEEIHVPLIILHPKLDVSNAAAVCPQVQLIDVAPTVLEMTGAAVAGLGAGRSLVPLLEGRAGDRQFKYAFSEGSNMRRDQLKMARSREWKLIEMRNGGYVLYDLVADPAETKNVLQEHPRAFAEMKRVLAQWTAAVRTPYPSHTFKQSEEEKALLLEYGYW